MTDIVGIAEKAAEIIAQHGTGDIWELLDRLGVITEIRPLGSAETGLKGYCTGFFDQFLVCVNEELPEYLRVLIAWHELGHIILDPDLLRNGQYIQEHDPLNMRTFTEKRANYFAAAGSVDGAALCGLLREGYALSQAAAILRVPVSFAVYKSEILRASGEKLPALETPDADCLGRSLIGKENF